MNLRLPHILLIALVFCTGTKSYAQREIHPLEPMFTYDYALKYYSNLHIIGKVSNYWSIENFKAPVGVKTVETLFDFHYYPAYRGFGNTRDKKIYHYNLDTGFLEEQFSLKISDKKNVTDTLIKRSFNYHFKDDVTIIESKTKSSDFNGTIIYTFQNQTGLLTKTASSYTTFKEDATQRSYSDTIEFEYNQLITQSVNKVKSTGHEHGKKWEKKKTYSISAEKESSPTTIDYEIYPEVNDSNNITKLRIENTDEKEERIGKEGERISVVNKISINISEKGIYYRLSQYERGLVLFDKNNRLVDYRLFEVMDRSSTTLNIARGYLSDGYFMFLSKKTGKRWVANLLDKNKKLEYRRSYWVKDRISKDKRKGYAIYIENYPTLIYNYK